MLFHSEQLLEEFFPPGSLFHFALFPRQHKLNLYGTEVEVRQFRPFRQFSGSLAFRCGFIGSDAGRWTIVVMKSLSKTSCDFSQAREIGWGNFSMVHLGFIWNLD